MSTHALRPILIPLAYAALVAGALVAAACSSTPDGPTPTPAIPTATVPGGTGTGSPSDANAVAVTTAEVLLLESYPVQVVLHVVGTVPTACHDLASVITDDGARLDVALTASSHAEACVQARAPFEQRIALGVYAAGARTVWLNGKRVGEFDLGAAAGDVVVTLGTTFTLRAGMAVTLETDRTLIHFDGVENDSRCPRDVVCIRAGDATVVLTITSPGGATTTARVLVDGTEGGVTAGGLRIRVTALAPIPVSTSTIAPDDYVATLIVER